MMNDEMDWDYYEYGSEEIKQQEIQSGIAQFNQQILFQDQKLIPDDKFNHFIMSISMEDLAPHFGLFAKKDSLITKSAGNLKLYQKPEQNFSIDFSKCEVPKEGTNQLIDNQTDSRIKSGSVVSTFPNTAIGIVIATFKNGKIQRGTASMCGPNHALSAAHIFKSQDKSPLQQVQFILGAVDSHSTYEQPEIARVISIKNSDKPENDLAVIVLNKPLGLYSGWFGLAHLCDETLKLQKVDLTGYPIEKEENNLVCQFTQSGKLNNVNSEYLGYTLEGTSGQNGGPIFAERQVQENQSEMYIVGVHIGRDPKNNKENQGVRINKTKIQQLKNIMEFHFIQESLSEGFYNQIISYQNHFIAEFDNCHMSTNTASDILFAIRNNLNLRNINIKIKNKANLSVLTDPCLKEFGESLKQLRLLVHLKADFFNCENLTDESLQHIGQGLTHLKDLEYLTLTFNGNSKFTNIGFKDLFNCMQSLPKLESLTIFLKGLTGINDDFCKYLGANVSKIPNLKFLKVDMSMLKKIGEKGAKLLVQSLENCKNFESVNFIFMGMNIDMATKQELKKKFKHVKKVSII